MKRHDGLARLRTEKPSELEVIKLEYSDWGGQLSQDFVTEKSTDPTFCSRYIKFSEIAIANIRREFWEHMSHEVLRFTPDANSYISVLMSNCERKLEGKSEIPKIIYNWDEKIDGDNSLQVELFGV